MSEMDGTPDRSWTVGTDLPVVGILSLCVVLAVLADYRSLSIVSTALSPLLVVFFPGYAIVAAVFPSNRSLISTDTASANDLDGLFRLTLAIGTSIAASGLLGIAMHLVSIPLTRWSVTVTLSALTYGGLVIAWFRRRRLDQADRYAPGIGPRLRPVRKRAASKPLTAWILPIIIVVTVFVSVSLVAATVDSPDRAESATELSVLLPSESNAAGEFPHVLSGNESQPVVISVENHESRSVEYAIVVTTQRTETRDGERVVLESVEHDTLFVSLEAGESRTTQYSYDPQLTGDSIRVAFSLYRGEPPENKTPRSAYREVHFWTSIKNGTVS